MVYRSKEGREYEQRIGTRVLVKRGIAYQTSGGLKANDIFVNKAGRYVSDRKRKWGLKHGKRQLEAAGYGLIKKGSTAITKTKRRSTQRRTR